MQEIPINWHPWVFILLSITLAGALGGVASWILAERNTLSAESALRWGMAGHVLLGIVSAFTVPFILTTLQSDLLSDPEKLTQPKTALTFFGICVIVAFASRRFMTTISDNLLRQLKENQRTSEEALSIAKQAEELSDEVHENLTDTAKPAISTKALPTDFIPPELTEAERRALNAAGLMSRRTRTGIAKDARIAVSAIGEVIDSLIQKRLISRTKSDTTGGLRFEITDLGIATLSTEKPLK
jgi:DNA-binding MarR family transcriptional regulator